MRLALGLGDVDEIGFGQRRDCAAPARDRDVVVLGETAHHFRRRVGDRGEPMRQLGARLRFDLDDQAAEHVVEQADMVFVEPACAAQEKAVMRLSASRALAASRLDDIFKLGDQRGGSGHPQSSQRTTFDGGGLPSGKLAGDSEGTVS